ncbi:MAG: thiopeptide-type bacteriocin biosynthesis protein, partial [Pseudonocardiaceae bacterium]
DASRWVESIYEPETHAFGGEEGMAAAHTLFHQDSRHIVEHLRPLGDGTLTSAPVPSPMPRGATPGRLHLGEEVTTG